MIKMAADPVSILFKRIGNDMYPRRHIKVSGQILEASRNEPGEFVNFVMQLDMYLGNCIRQAENSYRHDPEASNGENFPSISKNIRTYILSSPDFCWMLYRREHKKSEHQ